MFKQLKYTLFVPVLVLFVLVVYKSFQAPFTHDEAFSFEVYSSKPIPSIFAFKEEVSANNHLFNTLFMKGMSELGITEPGFLRMLSWASFCLFVWSLYQLFKNKKNYLIGFLFLIPCCSPYLLDFFSMARGYAFSFALMVTSLTLFIKINAVQKQQFWSIQIATLAMLANFNLVYVWFSLLVLYILTFVIQFKRENWIGFLKSMLFPTIAFMYLVYVFKQLSNAGQLYFGGNTGFLENVINDQLWCFIYDKPYSLNPYFLSSWQWTLPFLLVIALLLSFKKPIRANQTFKDWLIVLSILIFSLALIISNHYLTGSLYPIKRTGLFVSILLFLSLAMFFRFVFDVFPFKKTMLLPLILFVATLYVHTLYSFQPNRFREIPYDAHTVEIIHKLAAFKTENEVLRFSANWQFSPSFNFYKKTENLNWLPRLERSPIDTNAHFILVFEEDLAMLDTQAFQSILTYPEDQVYLLKRVRGR